MGKLRLFFCFAVTIPILGGCKPLMREPLRICPGKESIAEALSVLKSRSESVASLKAHGRCVLEYYEEEKKHKENFPVKLWVNPPVEIYFQGDVAFNPKGIMLGSNEHEFWLAMKPKEISSYWWGRWSESSCPGQLMISPKTLLEALGILPIGGTEDEGNWSLSNEGPFDVLTKRNEQGVIIKKIYIYCCDYSVRKIEYFEAGGEIAVVTELGKYKRVAEGFSVPGIINITEPAERKDDLSRITITLKSVKSEQFNEKQQRQLFTRPPLRGYEHVYRIIDGHVVEQVQR
jgi:hypothetical protein